MKLRTGPFRDKQTESDFQAWYKYWSKKMNLDPDPDNPKHYYDYRSAWANDAKPDSSGHWPSEFKREGHPRLIINGIDTRTGERVK